MPSKSMSPMHNMQPKIGDASLKFGPDWLRALSSDTANNAGGGDTIGRGGMHGGGGGWGGGMGHPMNSPIQRDYSATVSIHHPSFQHQSQNSQNKDGKDFQQLSSNNSLNRFKPSEFRYSREEMLSLYDKNLGAPGYLQTFGTLLIEKMQPPLAFSQPSEEEIRIWHTPQPESSRQGGVGATPMGRGSYSVRGRGSGLERGRGRGRGGYYGRPHEQDEERSFSRPRTFERSQSAHERVWAERNGNVGGPPGGEEGSSRGGSWRTREPYSGGRRHDDDDGWRKPRWRREGDEEDSPRTNSGRRLHKSWSEDDAHDNLPEWARDNPCEESGTFDASGAFHGDDRSKSKDSENLRDGDGNSRSSAESESHGSHNDRVQKRTPDRSDTSKSVIPPVVEEDELMSEKERYMTSVNNIESIEKMNISSNDSYATNQHNDRNMKLVDPNRPLDSSKSRLINQNHLHQVLDESHSDVHDLLSSKMGLRDMDSNRSRTTSLSKNSEDDPYRSMTEEAMNLVSKLIEEDQMSGSRGSSVSGHGGKGSSANPASSQGLMGGVSGGGGGSVNSNVSLGLDELAGNPALLKNIPVSGVVPSVVNHTASMDVWLYRDPQGSVQGPFPTHEMALWYSQGYFSANLLLRRECDKVFVTLLEMGRLYGRNPFAIHHDSPPPPPILEPLGSALDLHRNEGSGQPHFQRHQQQQQQQQQQQMLHQNILREQQQQQQHQQFAMGGMAPGASRKEEAWQQNRVQNAHNPQPIGRNAANAVPLSPDPVQAQLLLNLAKNQGLNVDANTPNPIDHLQALFQRQNMKNMGGDVPVSSVPQQQSSTNDVFNPMLHSQINPQMEVRKSPVNPPDPIQSLFQQLTNMTNTQQQQQPSHQQHKIHPGSTSEIINHWGGSHSSVPVQQPGLQGQWMSQSWDMNEQLLKQQKMHEEEMQRRQKEEEEKERKRKEEEQRKLLEEQKREMEERERKLREEEALKQQEAERARQKEIARQKELMIQQQQQRQMEQQRILEQQRLEQQRLEQQRQLELQLEQQRQLEHQRALEQQRQIEQQRQLEQQRQQQLLEKQRLEEQRRQQEQQQRELQEQQQREREQKLRLEEQQRERERQEQAKLQEQQRFSWNANSSQSSGNAKPPRTLLEIQQEEALKQEQEEHMRQQMLKKQMQQQEQMRQQQQQQGKGGMNLKWAQGAAPQQKVVIKSLTEIQAEEQAKLAKQKEKEREQRAMLQHHHQQQQAWSANLTWANRASLNAPPTSNKTNGGVWDEPSLPGPGQQGPSKHSFQNQSSGSKMNQPGQNQIGNNKGHQQAPGGKRTKDSEDQFMQLFQVSSKDQNSSMKQSANQDEFTKWCFESLQAMGGNVDIPTFVGFLKEVESPYEVSDYVRSYLGDGREAREFSREFLERRSRWKNARRGKDDGEGFEDNLCRPASAVNPNQNDFQEVKAKGKKGKKGKMQKVDARNLGFNVPAPNTGKRDYDEGTD